MENGSWPHRWSRMGSNPFIYSYITMIRALYAICVCLCVCVSVHPATVLQFAVFLSMCDISSMWLIEHPLIIFICNAHYIIYAILIEHIHITFILARHRKMSMHLRRHNHFSTKIEFSWGQKQVQNCRWPAFRIPCDKLRINHFQIDHRKHRRRKWLLLSQMSRFLNSFCRWLGDNHAENSLMCKSLDLSLAFSQPQIWILVI